MDVKRNRITNKYDVYVAHGEYITSYANMGSICVEKGQKVARNAQLGTIGSAVNIMTMETEYKLVFGIYPPNRARSSVPRTVSKNNMRTPCDGAASRNPLPASAGRRTVPAAAGSPSSTGNPCPQRRKSPPRGGNSRTQQRHAPDEWHKI